MGSECSCLTGRSERREERGESGDEHALNESTPIHSQYSFPLPSSLPPPYTETVSMRGSLCYALDLAIRNTSRKCAACFSDDYENSSIFFLRPMKAQHPAHRDRRANSEKPISFATSSVTGLQEGVIRQSYRTGVGAR